jgi:hypothetical protein
LPPESATSLKAKIEQLLTEARVIIPGGQALLGFQFVATLTKTLPDWVKWVHAAARAAVALSVLLLMTPAALHRLAFHGEDDQRFFEIGSKLVTAAALPLALGISADIAVVAYKITELAGFSLGLAAAAAVMFLCAWYAYPLAAKRSDSIEDGRRASWGT